MKSRYEQFLILTAKGLTKKISVRRYETYADYIRRLGVPIDAVYFDDGRIDWIMVNPDDFKAVLALASLTSRD